MVLFLFYVLTHGADPPEWEFESSQLPRFAWIHENVSSLALSSLILHPIVQYKMSRLPFCMPGPYRNSYLNRDINNPQHDVLLGMIDPG